MADLKGLKRICMSCGARFYDLNKKPIICPSCNIEFTGEIKVKARRGRIAAEEDSPIEKDAVSEDVVEAETEEIEGDEETVSLEDIEEEAAEDDEDAIVIEDDIDIEEDLDDLDDEIDEDIAEDEDK